MNMVEIGNIMIDIDEIICVGEFGETEFIVFFGGEHKILVDSYSDGECGMINNRDLLIQKIKERDNEETN